jgi:alpha-tubulin suppressor-like RCC1 family protein
MRYKFFILFIFLFFISCDNRSDCNGNCSDIEVCIDGNCVLTNGVCYNSSDCQPSEICETDNNICVDNPCEDWEIYDEDTKNCLLRDGFCYDDNNCRLNENCINHKCSGNTVSCNGIDCAGHGNCVININIPICNCDNGYQDNDDNLTCEPNCNTLDDCGEHALSCDDSSGIAVCTCDNGYYADSMYNCVNPCDNVICNNGICVSDGVSAYHCECNNGYHESNGECIAAPLKLCVGNYFTCVLLKDGKVVCFGDNSLGQLGNGNNISDFNPDYVLNIENGIDIVCGNEHACVLLRDKTVKCWGNNTFGQLGDSTFNKSNKPVEVINLNNVIELKSGSYHVCALLQDGKLKCWGMNLFGQLGNRKIENSNKPVYVVKDFTLQDFENIIMISSGGNHNCLEDINGDIWCWGSNANGELGINKDWHDYSNCRNSNCRYAGENQAINITQNAIRNDYIVLNNVDNLLTNGNFTAIIKSNDVYLFGENTMEQLTFEESETQKIPYHAFSLSEYDNIKIGGSQTCGMKNDDLYCLGRNLFGELGDINTIEKTYNMTLIDGVNGLDFYALGKNHNCAIIQNRVKCWGSNKRGELGVDNKLVLESSSAVFCEGF